MPGTTAEVLPGLFVDGKPTLLDGRPLLESVNPSNQEVLACLQVSSKADVDAAVLSARRAFDEGPWPRMRAAERAWYLNEIADLLEERCESLARLETLDTGLPISLIQGGHLPRTISHFRYFAAEAKRLFGQTYPIDDAYLNFVVREPVGVAAILTPWNAPLAAASINVAAALACGNTCILKPSELAPLSTLELVRIAHEAGLPSGVLNLVNGPKKPTGQSLVEHPGVDVVCLFGSVEAGRSVMRSAAGNLKRLGFELGGKAASIVLQDADLGLALDGTLLSVFTSNGEVCTAGSRIFVHRAIYREFTAAFVNRTNHIRVADPLDPTTEMGPLISLEHLHRVSRYLESGIREGALLECGGPIPGSLPGFYFRPAVLAEASNSMQVAREEVFGPIAAIIPFENDEQAVRLANDSEFGLSSCIWTSNVEKAMQMGQKLRVGTVGVNTLVIRDIRAPFGGYKQSGMGRIGGKYSIDLYSELKTTCLPIRPYALPRLGAEFPRREGIIP